MSADDPNNALQCITDEKPCCFSQNPQHGEWYLPNVMLVQGTTSDTAFFRSRGDNGEVVSIMLAYLKLDNSAVKCRMSLAAIKLFVQSLVSPVNINLHKKMILYL